MRFSQLDWVLMAYPPLSATGWGWWVIIAMGFSSGASGEWLADFQQDLHSIWACAWSRRRGCRWLSGACALRGCYWGHSVSDRACLVKAFLRQWIRWRWWVVAAWIL